MSGEKRAVVLLSGGMDSAVVLAHALEEGYDARALAARYGQRHLAELKAARRVARSLGVPLKVVRIDLRSLGGSALTDRVEVPKGRSTSEMRRGIPVTYVPARNTIFLAAALGYAETIGAADLFIGVNALDYSGYPDCRPEYIAAFEAMANLAVKAAVEGRARYRIHTPLIQMTKAEIVRRGLELNVDFSLTHSCYDPDADGRACGFCDACLLRKKGFAEAGAPDPTLYSKL